MSRTLADMLMAAMRSPQRPDVPAPQMFQGFGGQITPGNVDLFAQPEVKNPHGGISTVYSQSFNIDGREVLLPSVTPDGRFLATPDDIVNEYKRTGRHLGIFADPTSATAYAARLHDEYEAGKYRKAPR